tara:strand:+ start:6281 stop:7555 length:1275 start_codon:yes stop_codon:yes gene_type:complete
MKKIFFLIFVFYVFGQNEPEYIDGVAAIVEERIILKSDLAQMVGMAAIQNKIDPQKNPAGYLQLQNSIMQSMIDQKILLEMAEIDSVVVEEKAVDQALEQQIQMLISQAGGEKQASKIIGQPIKDFRREFWYDMRDRLISEKYQQDLLGAIFVTRSEIVDFFTFFKDSLSHIPTKTKIRHLLIPIKPSKESKEKAFSLLQKIKGEILNGESFGNMASEYSQDPGSKNNEGSLGWVTRGSLVKNFETSAFMAKENELIGPIETEFGFHLIETLEKQGDKILVRHILIIPEKTKKDDERAFNFATTLKQDSIKTLSDFKDAVKKYTADETTKKIGGNLGWIDPNNYTIPEIGQSIKYIEMNSCSPPINSSLGFHLLWVEDIKKGGPPNLTNHWAEIEQLALNKKKMDWYTNWISSARNKFYVVIKN